MEPNGYVVLCPAEGVEPTCAQVEAALAGCGLARWNGMGRPAVAVMAHREGKGGWFEAGYWAGAGVPLICLGGGHGRSCRRGNLVQRFNGWMACADLSDLTAAVRRALAAGVLS